MENHQKTLQVLAIGATLLAPLNAWAYLDPGTGSMPLSVFIGLISSAYFMLRKLPSVARLLFFRLTGKKDDLINNSIVFYAESAAYWSTFKPILEEFAKRNQPATYLTSDDKDPVFSAGLPDCIRAKFIGKGQTAYTALGFCRPIFLLWNSQAAWKLDPESAQSVQFPAYNDRLFGFSRKGHNIVVVMLDAFAGSHVKVIMNENPELHKQFAGFTWHRDTLATGPSTASSLPSILCGEQCTPWELNKSEPI